MYDYINNNNNCDCDSKDSKKLQLARAYILPQPYDELFSGKEAMKIGTIFKNLNKPYNPKKKGC